MQNLDELSCIDRGVDCVTVAAMDVVKVILTYFGALAGGVFLALTLSTAVGYLPYSDRPGPGWYGPQIPPLEEIAYYLDFSFLFLGRLTAIAAIIFLVLARILGVLHMPKWAIASYGALTVALVSLIAVSAAGWYIAIAAFPVYAGGVIGLLYGAVALPRFARPRSSEGRRWWHWALSPIAPAVIWMYFLFPR
jgi:hypothetical protein